MKIRTNIPAFARQWGRSLRKKFLKAADVAGIWGPDVSVWVEELLCFQKYMRVILHIRTIASVRAARIVKSDGSYELSLEKKADFILATGDFLTSGGVRAEEAVIEVELMDGAIHRIEDAVRRQIGQHDPFFELERVARDYITARVHDFDVLELGSRDREGTLSSWAEIRVQAKTYLGMDIVAGPNVHLVGDAHRLSSLVPGRNFDFIYSQFVFEHFAMPWVAAIEINKVLKVGGVAYMISNQSIGMHDLPWDFFRFSDSAWKALFNRETGFEILGLSLGDPMRLTPLRYHSGFADHEAGAGYQASSVFVRKISETNLSWPLDPQCIYDQLSRMYPKEIKD